MCAVGISQPCAADIFVALQGQTFFSPRSQGTDAARDISIWHKTISPVGKEEGYSSLALTSVYERSFRLNQVAEYFFGTQVLEIAGSEVATRNDTALLADYFGLSPAFQSVVRIKPEAQNVIADLGWYVGKGSFFMNVHIPITWAKTEVVLEEQVFDSGCSTPFPADYMQAAPLTAPYSCFKQAALGNLSYGQVQRLTAGKIGGCHIKGGVADIHCNIGWYYFYDEFRRLGLMARVVAPTGNRPTSEFLFEPVVGNGKHVELGFGITAATRVWEMDDDQKVDVLVDANVMHFFKTHQTRSFDLIGSGSWQRVGNWGSRYILAKRFNEDGSYSGQSLPLINATTVPVSIRVTIQVDAVVMLAYTYKNFGIDLGYNGWIRSKEHLGCPCFPDNTYGLKGIQNVTTGGILSNTTQSKASINGDLLINQAAVADNPSPVFVHPHDLNIYSAEAPLAYSHKLFLNVYRHWHQKEAWDPYLGLGAFVEFEGTVPNCVQTNRSSISQWGIWVKAGVGHS